MKLYIKIIVSLIVTIIPQWFLYTSSLNHDAWIIPLSGSIFIVLAIFNPTWGSDTNNRGLQPYAMTFIGLLLICTLVMAGLTPIVHGIIKADIKQVIHSEYTTIVIHENGQLSDSTIRIQKADSLYICKNIYENEFGMGRDTIVRNQIYTEPCWE